MRLNIDIRQFQFQSNQPAILRDINFSVDSGEVLCIIGPSGAGKTTLLRIIAGLLQASAGSVVLQDDEEKVVSPNVGFVFQTPRLMPWLSARDNISLVLQADDAHQTADRLLADVGLSAQADKYPGRMSGGMQRRVSLARAFSVKPDLLLMDEPFVSLDQPTAIDLRNQTLALCERYKPIMILVTHDIVEALCMADKIAFLSGAPATHLLNYEVCLEKPRVYDSEAIHKVRRELQAEHPHLLHGLENQAPGSNAQN